MPSALRYTAIRQNQRHRSHSFSGFNLQRLHIFGGGQMNEMYCISKMSLPNAVYIYIVYKQIRLLFFTKANVCVPRLLSLS